VRRGDVRQPSEGGAAPHEAAYLTTTPGHDASASDFT
jgi:hypothetical protein